MRKRDSDTESENLGPAFNLANIVWNDLGEGSRGLYGNGLKRSTFRNLNDSIVEIVDIAIDRGVRFGEDDFSRLIRFRGPFSADYGERFYARAVEADHISACQSYEKHMGRTPYFIDGKRVYVDREFEWEGNTVECRSFNDEEGYFNACLFDKPNRAYGRKVERRFKITHADLSAAKSST